MSPSSQSRLTEDDASGLVKVMAPLVAALDGWINILPVIPEDVDVPATPGVLAIFSKRGPVVPMATWTAPHATRRGTEPAQLGLQHGAGRHAAAALSGTRWEVPGDWRVVGDHPRRGMVLEAREATDLDVATWLLGALGELCIPPRTGEVDVFIYSS